jgi:hypothetical protein
MTLADNWKRAIDTLLQQAANWSEPPKYHHGCPVEYQKNRPVFRINPNNSSTFICRQDQTFKAIYFYSVIDSKAYWTASVQKKNHIWYYITPSGVRHTIRPGLTFDRSGEVVEEIDFSLYQDDMITHISSCTQELLIKLRNRLDNLQSEGKPITAVQLRKQENDISQRMTRLIDFSDMLIAELEGRKTEFPQSGVWKTERGLAQVYGEILMPNDRACIAIKMPDKDIIIPMNIEEFWQKAHQQQWVFYKHFNPI